MYEDHTSISRFPSDTKSYKMIASAIRRMAAQSADTSHSLGRVSTHSSNRSESHGN